MKVLKDGRGKLPTYRTVCSNCRSLLEYNKLDIKQECRSELTQSPSGRLFDGIIHFNRDYLSCPVCDHRIILGDWRTV